MNSSLRKAVKRAAPILLCIEVLLVLHPINIGVARIALILIPCLLVACMTALLWRSKMFRLLPAGLALLCVAAFLAPGREISKRRLLERYLSSLRGYEGVRYIWGGENFIGIDCSGLARSALTAANFKEGLLTANPRALRQAFDLWWHDASAREIGIGYGGRTLPSCQAKSLNSMDSSGVPAGAMAVTQDGVHVLVHLEGNEWMEADPGLGKVVLLSVPAQNSWFETPIRIVLWEQLAQQDQLRQREDR